MIARAIRRLDLRFEGPGVERAFWNQHLDEGLPHIRLAVAIGLVLYSSFGVLIRLRSEVSEVDAILRFGLAVPMIVATLVLSTRPIFRRIWQPLLAATVYVAIVAITIGWAASPDIPLVWNLAGILLLLAFAFSFTRIGYVAAWSVGFATLITYWVIVSVADRVILADQLYASFFIFAIVAMGTTTSFLLERSSRRLFLQGRELEQERSRSDQLLHNTFPSSIVERLKDQEEIADSNPEVSVLFADLVDFTLHSSVLAPEEVVELLGEVFGRFDSLTSERGLEKIKTIGDAYMAVAGAPDPRDDHLDAAAHLSLAMVDAVGSLRWPNGDPVEVRVGLACGPVVSGVIGQERFAYDLWGDTVNLASRLESSGEPNRVQVSARVHEKLGPGWRFSEPRRVDLKGVGPTTAWFLLDRA